MQKIVFTLLLLISTNFSNGQIFNIDGVYSISIPSKNDWSISTHYSDTINNSYQFITLRRTFKGTDRKFSSIDIKYELNKQNIADELEKVGCFGGRYTKVDSVRVSKFVAKRWFGINCNWLIENNTKDSITGYNLYMIICLEPNKYLRIICNYYSSNKEELNMVESDLLSLIDEIKIYNKGK